MIPRSIPSNRRRRWIRARLGSVLLACVFAAGVAGWHELEVGNLPHYQGRSVRTWFHELCRSEASGALRNEARVTECKRAMLAMGTNAVPYLLDEALGSHRDTALRTNLHELFRDAPVWLGGGRFVLYSEIANQAGFALHALRPPAELLLPRLTNHLASSNTFLRRQALLLLGSARHASPEVLAALQPALTNTTDAWSWGLASQSLCWLGTSASNALPTVLDALTHGQPNVGLYAWIGRFGPAAEPAVPLLETALSSTNDFVRLHAAVTLATIHPGHAAAWRALSEATVDTSELTPTDARPAGRPAPIRTPARTLCQVLSYGRRQPDRELAALIEPLARAEIASWNPKRANNEASTALARLAPERASSLYREALDGPVPTSAAGLLLRLERTNATAARVLEAAADRTFAERIAALWWLGEAASDIPGVTNFLFSRAGTNNAEGVTAAASLARLRLREERLAAGLPESEWE